MQTILLGAMGGSRRASASGIGWMRGITRLPRPTRSGGSMARALVLWWHGFARFCRPPTLVAAQVHRGDRIQIGVTAGDVGIAKSRRLHRLGVDLLRRAARLAAIDVIARQV